MRQGGLPRRYPGAVLVHDDLLPADSDSFSALHRLKSDDIYHFYQGDTVAMLQLLPDGTGKTVLLGNDLKSGERLQVSCAGKHLAGLKAG